MGRREDESEREMKNTWGGKETPSMTLLAQPRERCRKQAEFVYIADQFLGLFHFLSWPSAPYLRCLAPHKALGRRFWRMRSLRSCIDGHSGVTPNFLTPLYHK
jgi:hypothetical protein